ncbi:MAG: protein kinase [Deltaproteobacteria bacterium]|nr:protein kinase [Deltaproteobacteria bacterium]
MASPPEGTLSSTSGGRYRALGPLGQGSAAEVFRGVEEVTGLPCALKVLHLKNLGSRWDVRFTREAKALLEVQHPNVVRLLGSGATNDGRPFIAMELVEGKTLDKILGPRHASPIVGELLRQIAGGLAAGHAAGVVHRDLKPRNLMISRQGSVLRAQILDFGIARFSDDLALTRITASGTLLGTPAYMAPEQIENPSDADPRDDLYSLGIIGYALISGAIPFRGAPAQVLHAQLNEAPPELPPCGGLERLVQSMLEKSRANRPASALEVIRCIDELVGDEESSTFSELDPTLATIPEVVLTNVRTELHPARPEAQITPPLATPATGSHWGSWLRALNAATVGIAALAVWLLLGDSESRSREQSIAASAELIPSDPAVPTLDPDDGSAAQPTPRGPPQPSGPPEDTSREGISRGSDPQKLTPSPRPSVRENARSIAKGVVPAPSNAPARETDEPSILRAELARLGLRVEELGLIPELSPELDAWKRAKAGPERATRREALLARADSVRIDDALLESKLASLRSELDRLAARADAEVLEQDYLDLMSSRPSAKSRDDRRRLARAIEGVRQRIARSAPPTRSPAP